jgi:hypothetical protein
VSGMRPIRNRRLTLRLSLLGAVLVLFISGCSIAPSSVTPPAQVPVKPYIYVAVGGGETVGNDAHDPVRQAFPVLLDHQLPSQTTFYDLGVSGATGTDVLTHQLSAALSLHPNLVTVWLGVGDLEAGVSPGQFGVQLRHILEPLRAEGARVLVANVEPITLAPAYRNCIDIPAPPPRSRNFRCFVDQFFAQNVLPPMALVSAEISDYNAEIATIVRSDHAVLVNVHDSMTRQRSQNPSSLFSPDDFDLSTTGHALAAHLFISAWRRANQ